MEKKVEELTKRVKELENKIYHLQVLVGEAYSEKIAKEKQEISKPLEHDKILDDTFNQD
jgi:cell division protein FtsB